MKWIKATSAEVATHKDILKLAEHLYKHSYPYAYSDEDLQTAVDNWGQANCFAMVVEDDNGNMLGIMSFHLAQDLFYKDPIAVEDFVAILDPKKPLLLYLLIKRTLAWIESTSANRCCIGSTNLSVEQRTKYFRMLEKLGFTESSRAYTKYFLKRREK